MHVQTEENSKKHIKQRLQAIPFYYLGVAKYYYIPQGGYKAYEYTTVKVCKLSSH